jgi:UDP-N-acetylmuramate--alanine ligase
VNTRRRQKLSENKFHFVGVGGIGMCGLAELLNNMGAQVSGSDLSSNANTERLAKIGVKIFKGHSAANVMDADVVVYSSAVKDTNPEIQFARGERIPLIPRAEALAEIMRLKRGIAVAGTHGKTTTTSMVSSIFLEAQLAPTIVIGGRFDPINSTAMLGEGDWLLAEADESDGSFNKLSPEIAIITNIDSDHLDYFKSFENLENAFRNFSEKIPFYGMCIAWGDDPVVRKVLKDFSKRVVFYGFNSENDYVIEGSNAKYKITHAKTELGEFNLTVPGKHNALNATAALIAGLHAGIEFEKCKLGLEHYQGVDRRFQLKGEKNGVHVYDDYGHHPTEIRATLQGFREKFPDKRVVVLFQPHRFSRTESCWLDFTLCFSQCDKLILTDIYAAGENPIEGINSHRLYTEMKHKDCLYFPKSEGLTTGILSLLKPGDIFLTLGAGDGWKVGMEILQRL